MATWKTVNINASLIRVRTENAALVAMPHSSRFDGFCFWHPAKLLGEGRNSAAVSLVYSDEFVFRLKKYGRNNSVLNEAELPAADFEAVFAVIDKNIISPKPFVLVVHTPEKMEPVDIAACKELTDD